MTIKHTHYTVKYRSFDISFGSRPRLHHTLVYESGGTAALRVECLFCVTVVTDPTALTAGIYCWRCNNTGRKVIEELHD